MRTNFQFQNQNITMVKGDTLAFNVEIMDESGEPVIVDSAYFSCKKNLNDDVFTFQKTLMNGISQTDSILTVRIAPNDTRDVDAGEYFYDMQIGVGSDVYTLLIGTLSLMQDIT